MKTGVTTATISRKIKQEERNRISGHIVMMKHIIHPHHERGAVMVASALDTKNDITRVDPTCLADGIFLFVCLGFMQENYDHFHPIGGNDTSQTKR